MSELIRELSIDDLPSIREWRNSPEINKYMFSQHEITQQEHLAWFEATQQNELRHLFAFEENNELKGFLQLQQKSSECQVFEWGFYISPQAVKGTGTRMSILAMSLAFSQLGAVKLYAEVLGFNQASIRLHQKLGFIEEGLLRKQHFLNSQYHDVYCFGMLKEEWQQSTYQSKVGKS